MTKPTPGASSPTPGVRLARAWAASRATLLTLLLLVLWWLLYHRLALFADWYTFRVLDYPRAPGEVAVNIFNGCCGNTQLTPGEVSASVRQGRAIAFLLYQTPHVLMLLSCVIFLMGIVRSFFSPERTRALLAGRHTAWSVVYSALLGVLTPFCSCSAVPLFIGFLTAGVPFVATITFLTSAPMVNEIAIGQLFTQYGWHVAGLYLVTGLCIALATGWLMTRLRMQRYLEEWVQQLAVAPADYTSERLSWDDRLRAGLTALREILGRVWPYVLLGIVAGTLIHAFVSQGTLVSLLGRRHWWSVPLAVLVGVPIYSNVAGILPILDALRMKGVPTGTLLAFMMAVVSLSLPEFIILRKVLKPRLIAVFALCVALGITLVGLVFNLVLP